LGIPIFGGDHGDVAELFRSKSKVAGLRAFGRSDPTSGSGRRLIESVALKTHGDIRLGLCA